MLRILNQDNRILTKEALRFGKVKTDQTRLAMLRREYKLDDVVSEGKTEFERLLLLKKWVRSRWNHGWDHTPLEPPADAHVILKHADRGETFTCGTYSLVLRECYLSLGYQARVLGIHTRYSEFPKNPHNFGHCVTEVWSNDFRKWVVMDADKNCHYEKDGVPLGALEIRRAWLQREEEKVRLVLDTPKYVVPKKSPPSLPEWTEEEMVRQFRIFGSHKTLPYYHYIQINNNSLGMPVTRWTDRYSPPQLILNGKPHPHNVRYVDREIDFNWPVNQTHMSLECRSKKTLDRFLKARLTHSMPDFQEFQVKIDYGSWSVTRDRFLWELKPGFNRLACKAVNTFRVEGPESFVKVEYR